LPQRILRRLGLEHKFGKRRGNFSMTRLVRVSALAGASLLAGCTSWSPSWDWVPSLSGSGANVSLTIESDPPGADAKTSLGPSCRTPCMLPVPGDREFTVNYSLNGYLPQTIAVVPRTPDNPRPDVESGGAMGSVEVTPNPVYAQLQPAPPPPPPTRKGRGRPKAKKPAAPKQQPKQ
jgi:hypothetical protein